MTERPEAEPARRGGGLLALAAVALTLLLLEGGARLALAPPRYHDVPLELHPELGFRGVPGTRIESADARGSFLFTLNSLGLRGAELPPSPPAAPLRVAFLGDSFLVGRALREDALVPSLTEAALRERGVSASVYNLSVIDYGTAQQLLLLRALAPRLEPDAVVLVLHPGNDVVNNSPALAGRTPVSAGDYIRPYLVSGEDGSLQVDFVHPVRGVLRRHSRLFATLERRILAAGSARGIAWLEPWPAPTPPQTRVRAGLAPLEELELFRRHDPAHPWEQAWRSTFAILRALRDECRARGARLLVVVLPGVDQVTRTARRMGLEVMTLVAGGRPLDQLLDWSLPETRLADFLAAEGIEARFLLPRLRDAVDAGQSVYGRDDHLSRRGHEIAAQPVIDWLLGVPAEPDENAPQRLRGFPVSRLPAADEAPAMLDFAEASHEAHLGHGWLAWRPTGTNASWGWLVGIRALAVLPDRPGTLRLDGFVPQGARLPLTGRVEIAGETARRFRVERSGPFTLRVPRASPATAPTLDGYLVVMVDQEGWKPAQPPATGLVVRSLGFASEAAETR
ncbi:MAG: hypothetical protein QNK04_21430 [Myxococcota bacterium]|nr:hypothetical protein [Myxococcota bacterium]